MLSLRMYNKTNKYLIFRNYRSFQKFKVPVTPLNVIQIERPTNNGTYRKRREEPESPLCTGFLVHCLTDATSSLHPKTEVIRPVNALDKAYPWHASILIEGKYKCSGVLLDKRWVLIPSCCIEGIQLVLFLL